MPADLVRVYAAELINCLDVQREYSVVHRDLKPENILIDENWHIKVTDYGDSKIIENLAEVEEEVAKLELGKEKKEVTVDDLETEIDLNFGNDRD